MNITRKLGRRLLGVVYRCGYYYLRNRTHLPVLLNAVGLRGEGAEVGVSRGMFSEQILRDWQGSRLFSIDPWQEFSPDKYCDVTNVPQALQEQYFTETTDRLAQFGDRSRIMRMTSADASREFHDRQLDFVYIDAQHHYEAVKEDLHHWYPKIRSGGLVAGHDYLDGSRPEGEFGVKSAVDEFVRDKTRRLFVSADQPFPSWFFFVP